jgi:hypothetical protein
MTIAAIQGRHRLVRPDVTGAAVAEFWVELKILVAIQADAHGADYVPAHRIEAMTHAAMAVAARHACHFAVSHFVVGSAQSILRELVGQVAVTGHADFGATLAGIRDEAVVSNISVFSGSVAMVAGYTIQSTVGCFWWLRFDNQVCDLVLSSASVGQGLWVLVAGQAACP